MPVYRYRAARADGTLRSGVIEAARAKDANVLLAGQGLLTVTLREALYHRPRQTIARRDLALVFRSLASLVAAGVPLEKALAATQPITSGKLHAVLESVRRSLRDGSTFSRSLAQSGEAFPPVVLGILQAGDRGSRLAQAIEEVAGHLEQEAELTGRIRQAMAYPVLLAILGTVAILVIGTVVVPRFADLLGEVGQDLPATTRLLLTVSEFLRQHWLLLLAGTGGAVALIAETLRRPQGQRWRDRLLLDVPLLGTVRHHLAAARICRSAGGMLLAGLPLITVLDVAKDAGGDAAVAGRLMLAREAVTEGAALTPSLAREKVLPPALLQVIGIGESSGQLGVMMVRAGDLGAMQAERSLRTLTTMIEPALIVAFGGVIAFVAAALLQAVYGLRAV